MEKMLAKAVQLREVTQMITPEVVSKSVRQAVADIVNDLGKEVDEPEMLEQLRAFGMGPGAALSAAGRPPQSGRRPAPYNQPQGPNQTGAQTPQQMKQFKPCFLCGQLNHWQNECPWKLWLQQQLQAGATPQQVPTTVPQVVLPPATPQQTMAAPGMTPIVPQPQVIHPVSPVVASIAVPAQVQAHLQLQQQSLPTTTFPVAQVAGVQPAQSGKKKRRRGKGRGGGAAGGGSAGQVSSASSQHGSSPSPGPGNEAAAIAPNPSQPPAGIGQQPAHNQQDRGSQGNSN